MRKHNLALFVILIAMLQVTGYSVSAGSGENSPTIFTTENVEQLSRIPPPWIEAKSFGQITYFSYASPAQLKRYNMAGGVWLPDISLSAAPTAFTADDDGIYIALGKSVYRTNLFGTGIQLLYTSSQDVTDLFTINEILYVLNALTLTSVNKDTGVAISQITNERRIKKIAASAVIGRAIGRSTSVSPADIVSITLNNDGSFGSYSDSPYHGDFPQATRTYLFPDSRRVVDDSGIIYSSNDLVYNGSLGERFDDVQFYFDQPVVARNGILFAYSASLQLVGRYAPLRPPQFISIYGDKLYSFFGHDSVVDVTEIPPSTLDLIPTASLIDPSYLRYTPENIFLGNDGIVYFFHRASLAIFRWSIAERRYLDSINLASNPQNVAYSSQTNRIYLLHRNGDITQIRLNESFQEQPFASVPTPVFGLSTAGEFVFVCAYSPYWLGHYTYSPEGDQLSQSNFVSDYSLEYVWNDANRKMYYIYPDDDRDALKYEAIDANGMIIERREADLAIQFNRYPIRVAPDGSIVVMGNGQIFNAQTLVSITNIGGIIQDSAWISSTLYTGQDNQIQKRDSNYQVVSSKLLPGRIMRMLSIPEGLLIITNALGMPDFTIVDDQLDDRYTSSTGFTLLPMCLDTRCIRFMDDFSDPSSGWPVGNDSLATYGYYNGEFRSYSKRAGYMYLYKAPTCRSQSYTFEVDARWVQNKGNIYGILYNILGDFELFQALAIDPTNQNYYYITFDGVSLSVSSPFYSAAIHTNYSTNHLKFTQSYDNGSGYNSFKFEVNGVVIINSEDDAWPYISSLGIFSTPYSNINQSDARFDNFSFSTGSGYLFPGALQMQSSGDDLNSTALTSEPRSNSPVVIPFKFNPQ